MENKDGDFRRAIPPTRFESRMTTVGFQTAVRELRQARVEGGESLAYHGLGLASEAGEVAGEIKKYVRGGAWGECVVLGREELGDVLWFVACLCDDLGLELGDVMAGEIDKVIKKREGENAKPVED